jgi:hypothetical protein
MLVKFLLSDSKPRHAVRFETEACVGYFLFGKREDAERC